VAVQVKAVVEVGQDDEDDEGLEGLEFYDPIKVDKQAKEEAAREREQENPTMVKINGKMVHAALLN